MLISIDFHVQYLHGVPWLSIDFHEFVEIAGTLQEIRNAMKNIIDKCEAFSVGWVP